MSTQITSGGKPLEPKKGPITLPDVVPASAGRPRGIYVHVPFCFHKCHYCDFYSIVDSQDRAASFVPRLLGEIDALGRQAGDPLETVFVGGGTPTLLPPDAWTPIVGAIRSSLGLAADAEITVEANPETVSDEVAAALAAAGVNRVSVGCQSFDPRHLKTLERWHDPANVAVAVERLRAVGIDRINLDLIFAVPGQTAAEWADDVERALDLEPDHMSCYGLTYEPNTPITVRMERGDFDVASQELEAEMYEHTMDRLAAAGLDQYEISNWARPGEACRHNVLYWRNADWLTAGPGAAGHIDGVRWKNAPRLQAYLESEGLPPIVDVERLDAGGRLGETLMLGLRLNEGIAIEHVAASDARRREALETAQEQGWIARDDTHLRLTRAGRLMADAVLTELI